MILNRNLESTHPNLFQNPPQEGWVSTLFREGIVEDFVLKCLSWHREYFTHIDFHFLEGDDASLKGIKTKCVSTYHTCWINILGLMRSCCTASRLMAHVLFMALAMKGFVMELLRLVKLLILKCN